jgi:hypothetical protein
MTAERRCAGLFLGVDPYVLNACPDYGLDAIVAVGAGTRDFGLNSVPEWAETLLVDDQSCAESVLAGLARNPDLRERVSFVQTTDERALVCAAVVAKALGVDGPDPDTMLRFRDKSIQKHTVREAGIRVARAVVIDDIHTVDPSEVELFDRSVLKPVAGAGTSLTMVIDGHDDLVAAVTKARSAATRQRTFILEEFVSGSELTADGVVVDGEVRFFALGEYDQPCLAAVIADRCVQTRKLDPETDAELYARVAPTVRGSLRALGLLSGVFHMELFVEHSTGDVWFSECAARRGGGLTHEEVAHKFSVSLGHAALALAAGLSPSLDVSIRPGFVGAAFLPMRDGILLGSPSAEDLLEQSAVEYARVELPIGFHMQAAIKDTIARVGQVLLRADTLEDLLTSTADVIAWFDAQMDVLPTALSPAELRDRQHQLAFA